MTMTGQDIAKTAYAFLNCDALFRPRVTVFNKHARAKRKDRGLVFDPAHVAKRYSRRNMPAFADLCEAAKENDYALELSAYTDERHKERVSFRYCMLNDETRENCFLMRPPASWDREEKENLLHFLEAYELPEGA